MSKYTMGDGTIVDTDKARNAYEEATRWDGNNHISKATGDQWVHEKLFQSRKGNWYLEHWSQWQGSTPSAEWVTERRAAEWLLANEHDLPESLAKFAELIEE